MNNMFYYDISLQDKSSSRLLPDISRHIDLPVRKSFHVPYFLEKY